MPDYPYVIVGAGLAGASAIETLRERDPHDPVLLIGAESHPPYHRPPLSKKLWLKSSSEKEIFVHEAEFDRKNDIIRLAGRTAIRLDPLKRKLTLDDGSEVGFQKLLLATGVRPRRLTLPGGDLPGVIYYRTLDDYRQVRAQAKAGKVAVIIGGGFIGSEMAVALLHEGLKVHLLFPDPWIGFRIFPAALGQAIQAEFSTRGATILAGDQPTAIERVGDGYRVLTQQGRQIDADLIIAGVGAEPAVDLAVDAGLMVDNGIVVNAYLQTSHPDIFAAGDNARFPSALLGIPQRVEHWDNAQSQGRAAGRNLAGARIPYDTQPYFFSDLFDWGYEAVGDVRSDLITYADWEIENKKGVVYYLEDGKVRGVLMCNVWDQVDRARELIRRGERMTPERLHHAIR